MPDRLACDEAMNLSKARLRVQDSDLKQGEVEKTLAGQIPVPWGLQGGFAVVYKFRAQSGKVRALRCYLVPMKTDIQYRYEQISTYFAAHIPKFTAEFNYHKDGILIREAIPGTPEVKKPFSLIEMEWIEGPTLLEHIASLCQHRDQAGLADILQQWLDLLQALRQAHIAHCDLAGNNIMVRPDGRLILVDYDGVYIPQFQGLGAVVEGQVDYQHPHVRQRPFDEQADTFSALVIYTAILALHLRPELWTQYMSSKVQETHLLFKHSDYPDPANSALFTELAQITDPRLQTALQDLKQACQLPVDQIPLSSVFDEADRAEKAALTAFEQTLPQNDEEALIQAWLPLLETYTPAQKYRPHLTHAYQIQQKRLVFRATFPLGSLQEIVQGYDADLDASPYIPAEERHFLQLAQTFLSACQSNDDQAILQAYNALLPFPTPWQGNFTSQEKQHITLARQRLTALDAFRQALSSKNISAIVAAYTSLLDASTTVTLEERAILQAARDFLQAFANDDDRALLLSGTAITQRHSQALRFSIQEEERLLLAKNRLEALAHFQQTLHTRLAGELIAAYAPILDICSEITPEQRAKLQNAQRFMQMYSAIMNGILIDNDEQIVTAYDESLFGLFQDFTPSQQARLYRALRYQHLEKALKNDEYAQALLLAQEIEMATRTQITDVRLLTAKRRFIRQYEVHNVRGRRIDDEVVVQWHWPADELVRYVLIVWRTDHWPQHPYKQEAGTGRTFAFRAQYEQVHIERFLATRYMPVFLQAFFAMPDYTQQPPAWFFSNGLEPTSKVAVYYSDSGLRVL